MSLVLSGVTPVPCRATLAFVPFLQGTLEAPALCTPPALTANCRHLTRQTAET
jgi:hypothetical protein